MFRHIDLRGCRLNATDTDWSAGEGAEVGGPISSIVLLLTGPPAGLTRLSGPGLTGVRSGLLPG